MSQGESPREIRILSRICPSGTAGELRSEVQAIVRALEEELHRIDPHRKKGKHMTAPVPDPAPAQNQFGKPTAAFIGAAWAALALGIVIYFIGLWRADMETFEKGFYFATFLFGLLSAVSLQKSVRDRHEGVPVTSIYLGVAWIGLGLSLAMLAWSLWNSDILPSEKGFYALGFALSVFAVIVVQKNVRDQIAYKAQHPEFYGADAIQARRQTAQREDLR